MKYYVLGIALMDVRRRMDQFELAHSLFVLHLEEPTATEAVGQANHRLYLFDLEH